MQNDSPRTIAILGYDGCNAVDVFGPMQVFSTANAVVEQLKNQQSAAYKILLLCPDQSTLRLSTGTQVIADKRLDRIKGSAIDTLVIAGGNSARENAQNANLLRAVARLDSGTRRTVSVCTGAFILAATGALDERRATTHWKYAAQFQARFESTELDIDSLFTQDGSTAAPQASPPVSTWRCIWCKRITAAESHWKPRVRWSPITNGPAGKTSSALFKALVTASVSRYKRVQEWLHSNLQQKLDVESLADKAHMSTRHFSRKFSDETGLSPARYLALARLNQARVLLEESNKSINQVATLCGYADAELMRRLFVKELNVRPSEYRKRFSIL